MEESVYITGKDAFLHTLVIGPTGSGKTSRILMPMVYQVLKAYANGNKVGMTLIEPKGDFAQDVVEQCERMGIPYHYIDPLRDDSASFNPLIGDPQQVSEMIRTVLRRMFGRQKAFFAQVQETAARNTTKLLKMVHGDNITLLDLARALRNVETIQKHLADYKQMYGSKDDLAEYFEIEVIKNKENYQMFATGLRMQLEDIVGNAHLQRIFLGENPVDLRKHLEEGGVLVVNTAMGELGKLGDVFGIFVLMNLQNAVFSRPGTEETRRPHYLFVDEFPRYVNPDIERLLAIGRSFRCACIFAVQGLSQLDVDGNKQFRNVVLTNCRNKIVFGGINYEEAEYMSHEFGKEFGISESKKYDTILGRKVMFADGISESEAERLRITATQIKEAPAFHFFYQLVRDGQPLPPGLAEGRVLNKKTGELVLLRPNPLNRLAEKVKRMIEKTKPAMKAQPQVTSEPAQEEPQALLKTDHQEAIASGNQNSELSYQTTAAPAPDLAPKYEKESEAKAELHPEPEKQEDKPEQEEWFVLIDKTEKQT